MQQRRKKNPSGQEAILEVLWQSTFKEDSTTSFWQVKGISYIQKGFGDESEQLYQGCSSLLSSYIHGLLTLQISSPAN